MTGERIILVVWDGGGLYPYAAAFSTKAAADTFAATIDGQVIDTFVDVHAAKDESHAE